jgi:hypothetical protein
MVVTVIIFIIFIICMISVVISAHLVLLVLGKVTLGWGLWQLSGARRELWRF